MVVPVLNTTFQNGEKRREISKSGGMVPGRLYPFEG